MKERGMKSVRKQVVSVADVSGTKVTLSSPVEEEKRERERGGMCAHGAE